MTLQAISAPLLLTVLRLLRSWDSADAWHRASFHQQSEARTPKYASLRVTWKKLKELEKHHIWRYQSDFNRESSASFSEGRVSVTSTSFPQSVATSALSLLTMRICQKPSSGQGCMTSTILFMRKSPMTGMLALLYTVQKNKMLVEESLARCKAETQTLNCYAVFDCKCRIFHV